MLTLYQAEWCPYSSAVRERLTELGLDFAALQVAPRPEQRLALRAATGVDEIPTLVTEEGEVVAGAEAILGRLEGPGTFAAEHRGRYAEHRHEREQELTASLLERLAPLSQ